MSRQETTTPVRPPENEPQARFLVLAPYGGDGAAVSAALGGAGLELRCCPDIDELCTEIERGAAGVILAEEALSGEACRRINEVLAGQPAWSDLPLLLVVSREPEEQDGWFALEGIEGTAHLTLLERPLHAATLVSAARAAAQSRARQYQIRDELAAGKQVEQQLRESESRYRDLVESANSAIIRWKLDGTVTFVNRFAQEFFGYREDEMLGQSVRILVPQTDSEGTDLSGLIEAITAHPERYAANVNENVCRDGRRVWMAWTNRPFFDEAGRVTEILSVATDITGRKRAEEALELQSAVVSGINRIFHEALLTDNAQRLGEACLQVAEAITGSGIAFIAEINQDSGLLDSIAISYPGWKACEIDAGIGVRRPPMSFQIHGIYGRVVLDGKAFFTNDPASHPDRIGTPSGHPPLESFLGVPLFRGSTVTGMVAVGNRPGGYGPEQVAVLEALAPAMVEAFARQEVERNLRENREDLARAQAVGQIGSWRLDVQRNVLSWSDESYRLFGIPKGTPMTYESFLKIVHPDDRRYLDARWNAAIGGEPYDIEHRILVDGEVRWVREKAYLEFDEESRLRGGFGITQDITDRKKVEEELELLNETLEQQVAERTAVAERRARDLRRMAVRLSEAEHRERARLSMLLHDDLQQLLLAAKLRLPVLLARDERRQVEEDVTRLEELLTECMSTSRNLTRELSPPILQRGTLADVIHWLGDWYGEKYGLTVVVNSQDVLPRPPEYLRVFLFQAVRELLLNVVKHSGEMSATVTLVSDDGMLTVAVEDGGNGFDPRAIEECLEHPQSFGLFNIRERVDALRGRLVIEASPHGGARFRLVVPLGEDNGPPMELESQLAETSVGTEPDGSRRLLRLLVVDDHKVVREGLVGLLDRQPDLEVVGQAGDGREAIRLAESLLPDVVTMDVDMPGVDGVEATRQIKLQHPEIVVIGLSLYEGGPFRVGMTQAGADAHLSKHSSAQEIVDAIRRVARRKLSRQ